MLDCVQVKVTYVSTCSLKVHLYAVVTFERLSSDAYLALGRSHCCLFISAVPEFVTPVPSSTDKQVRMHARQGACRGIMARLRVLVCETCNRRGPGLT